MNEPQQTLKRICNLTPRGDWGYMYFNETDGTILVGKSGDSDWVEIPKEVSDLFGFEVVI